MKLRNKKTGEIWDIGKVLTSDYPCWETLNQICKDWEDIKEPLIKDAGMREALRLWAKVNLIPSNATTIEYQLADTLKGTFTEFWHDDLLHIMFYGNIAPNAVHGKVYTIDELCGEEEE